jgi:hypothetical protein
VDAIDWLKQCAVMNTTVALYTEYCDVHFHVHFALREFDSTWNLSVNTVGATVAVASRKRHGRKTKEDNEKVITTTSAQRSLSIRSSNEVVTLSCRNHVVRNLL